MQRLARALGSSSSNVGSGLFFLGLQRQRLCLLSRGVHHWGLEHRHASSSSPVSAEIASLKQRLVQVGMSEHAFKEPTRPQPLITDVVFEGFYDREASLTALCDAFSTRLQIKKANPSTTDRKANPIVAIAAGPGAGKTRFIDACMTLGKVGSPIDLAAVCPDQDLHKELERCIPIPVTYNSFCAPSGLESNLSLEHSLICRMLYSYFCWANVPFDKFFQSFCRVAPEFDFVSTLGQVVSAIGNDGQQPVFLAVDELMKATAISRDVMPLLTYIGSVLDNRPSFHAMVSSLDPDVVGNITASSGRPVRWVSLSPMSYKHSIEAVAKHGLQFVVNKGTMEHPELVERSLESEECRAVRAVIADCNGHPRSLEAALDILRTYSVNGDKSPKPLPPYSQLIDQLAIAVEAIYDSAIMACPSIDELVSPALWSDSIDFEGSPHDRQGAPTYSSYIASGLYLNSKLQTHGIPLLSPLLLRVILNNRPKWRLADCIKALLSMDEVRWPDGFAYERFHAQWECLWRELHRMHGKNETSLLEFYGLASTKSVFKDVYFQVAPKAVAQLGSDLTDDTAQVDLKTAICLPKKPDQAGFDLATVETVTAVASKGKEAAAAAAAARPEVQMKLLLCHECKYSLRDRPKSHLPQMLEAKYKNWKEQMEKWTTINDEAKLVHKRLIAVVFRTPSEHAPVTDKEDMLVVVRRQLEKLYGPTLASRPQFLVDYDPTNQQQQGPTGNPSDAVDNTNASLPHNQ